MQAPIVSIIVPVYNGIKYISNTLDTLLAQSFKSFEVLLINDGSTDTSLAFIQQLAEKDNRIRVLDKVNGGIANARNYGINLAQGEFIAFCDQDDFWEPNKLQKQIPLFSNDSVGLVYSLITKEVTYPFRSKIVIEAQNGRGSVFNSLIRENLVPTCSVIVRKGIIVKVGGFNEKRDLMGVDDWDVWLRVSLVADFDFVPGALATHIYHGENYSLNNLAMHNAELFCLQELQEFVHINELTLNVNWKLIESYVHIKYYSDYMNDGLFNLAKKALYDANALQFNLSILLKYNLLSVIPNALLHQLQKFKRSINS